METKELVKDEIDMTGKWFVNFGYLDKMEGSRIITLNGWFNQDDLLDKISDAVYESLNDDLKRQLDGLGAVVIIRNLNRIG